MTISMPAARHLPARFASGTATDTSARGVWAPLRDRFGWLSGLVLNLGLSLLYLSVAPLTGQPHRDWAILVGSYFAGFILADVTTTNALGADARRVGRRLAAGTPLWRILLAKNLALLLIVGLPTLIATALITITSEPTYRLALTLPGVLLPVLSWLGIGNLVSVALPTPAVPVRQRWQQRRDLRSTGRWLFVLALPYALCLVVDPMSRLPLLALHALGRAGYLSGAALVAGLTAGGLLIYLLGSGGALLLARGRVLRLADTTEQGRSERDDEPESCRLAG